MLIKSFTIENFKCIGKPLTVDFKPITLLFGPNSSGKSTIIQALHYAWEIFEFGNVNPNKSITGAPLVDLGDFKNILHNNDLTKSISLRFDLEISGYGLPDYGGYDYLELDSFEFGGPIAQMDNIWVKIRIKWSFKYKKPVIISYEVGSNNELLARIIVSEDIKEVYLGFFNFRHPIFYDFTEYKKVKTPPEGFWFWDGIDKILILKKSFKNNVKLRLYEQKTVLPPWGEVLNISGNKFFKKRIDNDLLFMKQLTLIMISFIVVGPGHVVQNSLKEMRYIGPLRELPQRNYNIPLLSDKSRWATGMAAWDILHEDDNKLIEKTNEWLTYENFINSDYKIEVKNYRELPDDIEFMKIFSGEYDSEKSKKAKELLDNLPVKKQVFLRDQKRDILVKPQDVGTGISQVLPVIVGALDLNYGMMIIEQPELHIHPAFQVTLGDLFISQMNGKRITILVETHSEHLMLRFLRRIRETGKNKLSNEEYKLTPEQLVVYFAETDIDGMRLTQLRVDKDGEFIDLWPEGFFEEREDELLY